MRGGGLDHENKNKGMEVPGEYGTGTGGGRGKVQRGREAEEKR